MEKKSKLRWPPPRPELSAKAALWRGLLRGVYITSTLAIVLLLLTPGKYVGEIEIIGPESSEDQVTLRLQTLYEANHCSVAPWTPEGVPFPTKVIYYEEDLYEVTVGGGKVFEAAVEQVYGGVDHGLHVLAWCP